jgi:hypothetical protein
MGYTKSEAYVERVVDGVVGAAKGVRRVIDGVVVNVSHWGDEEMLDLELFAPAFGAPFDFASMNDVGGSDNISEGTVLATVQLGIVHGLSEEEREVIYPPDVITRLMVLGDSDSLLCVEEEVPPPPIAKS